jgi:hypothetical protein
MLAGVGASIDGETLFEGSTGSCCGFGGGRPLVPGNGGDPERPSLLRACRFVITGRFQCPDAASDIRSDLTSAACIAGFFLGEIALPNLNTGD